MTTLLRIAVLEVVWLALWSDLSTANVLSGVLVAGAIVLTFDTWGHGSVVVRPVAIARFAGYFVVQLVWSTIVVARTIITPSHRINRGIVAVPLRGCSDAMATLIADAISLTPGTLTIEIEHDPLTLYVHALDVRDVEQVRRDVRRLERLAVRAFGDDEALAGLELDDSHVRSER